MKLSFTAGSTSITNTGGWAPPLTHWVTQRERNVKFGTTGLTLEVDEEGG